MRRYIHQITLGLGLFFGGLAVDDAITDRYKDISPKEFLGASVTLVTTSTATKKKGGE